MGEKIRYVCRECGYILSRWAGRCPGCAAWNTLVEEKVEKKDRWDRKTLSAASAISHTLRQLTLTSDWQENRYSSGLTEMDRVLGGGILPGAVILLGGEPGVGKSTLLLQVADNISKGGQRVLYATAEESLRQVAARATRLNLTSNEVHLLAEANVLQIEAVWNELGASLLIIDSVQAIYHPDLPAAPGSVSQVRECTALLLRRAKEREAAVILVGHVTKEGIIAGPRVLEHMVDTVLYLEGERFRTHRLLRCVKNRFGSTNEVGILEMSGSGLREVANPSAFFLDQKVLELPGVAVVPLLEGTRPLLVELQALVAPAGYGAPRRLTTGVDYNRVVLMLAVLEKRVGLMLGQKDVYVNAVGGVQVAEPAADLSIALAIASAHRDVALPPGTVVMGEVGLAGEVRPVVGIERRVREAAQLGFKRCLVPATGYVKKEKKWGQDEGFKDNAVAGIELIPVSTVQEAVDLLLL